MKKFLLASTIIFVIGSSYTDQKIIAHLSSMNHVDDSSALVNYLQTLIAGEKMPLMKRHFESLLLMTQDKTNGYAFT